jgi:hypothetical protein
VQGGGGDELLPQTAATLAQAGRNHFGRRPPTQLRQSQDPGGVSSAPGRQRGVHRALLLAGLRTGALCPGPARRGFDTDGDVDVEWNAKSIVVLVWPKCLRTIAVARAWMQRGGTT